MTTSENLEMYLVTIALLDEQGLDGPVPLSLLAEELAVQPVSANQMVRKLDEEGLVTYQPYKGVSLTDEGKRQTMHIIRHRRLWEVFFTEKLGIPPIEADALACRMEHITTNEVAERLYQYLDRPQVTAGGKLIPRDGQQSEAVRGQMLTELHAGQQVEVVQMQTDEAETAFLQSQGIIPGAQLVITAASNKGAMLVDTGGLSLSLSDKLAARLRVRPLEVS